MGKHTPGPWKADVRTGCVAVYPASEDWNCLADAHDTAIHYQSGRGERAGVTGYRMLTDDQAANARLIAAAPELLEALQAALPWLEDRANEEVCIEVRAAISKAEGEEGEP